MLLLIDNHDSFTYNLAHYFLALGCKTTVINADELSIKAIEQQNPRYIVLSPGPGRPTENGFTTAVVKHFHQKIPLLGVCLGHQTIAYAFGADIIQSKKIMHGKTSTLIHANTPLFENIPQGAVIARYHSLVIDSSSLPQDFAITAWSDSGEIMAIEHRQHPVMGVQYHPEAILSEHGDQLLSNFLAY